MRYILRAILLALAFLFGISALVQAGGALSTGDRFMILPIVITALLAAACVYGARKFSNQAPPDTNRLADEAADYFEYINRERHFPETKADRVISRPGAPVLAACNARLMEITSDGARAMAGTRIKIGNQPFYIGGGRSAATHSLKETAAGELAITPQTLIFVGDIRSVDIPLSKISAVDMALDGVTLAVQGRQRPITFILPNGLLWAVLIKNLMQLQLTSRELPPGAQIEMM